MRLTSLRLHPFACFHASSLLTLRRESIVVGADFCSAIVVPSGNTGSRKGAKAQRLKVCYTLSGGPQDGFTLRRKGGYPGTIHECASCDAGRLWVWRRVCSGCATGADVTDEGVGTGGAGLSPGFYLRRRRRVRAPVTRPETSRTKGPGSGVGVVPGGGNGSSEGLRKTPPAGLASRVGSSEPIFPKS